MATDTTDSKCDTFASILKQYVDKYVGEPLFELPPLPTTHANNYCTNTNSVQEWGDNAGSHVENTDIVSRVNIAVSKHTELFKRQEGVQ